MLRATNIIYKSASNRASSSCTQLNLILGDAVRHALENNLPVVALESTIITHGMPYPQNVECAMACERKILQAGATPATIAILKGRVTIGLTNNEIEEIAEAEDVVKTSRRDFAHVVGNKLYGGTTVSGTLVAAKMAGIRIFATGGIGGVHRHGEKTMDISADLQEMGRTPIAVVSAGVKSILDIPRTLEYLESQGVYVATVGPTKNFPAFYTRQSGSKSAYSVNDAREAAVVIKANTELGLESGMLFAVPVPEEHAMEAEVMERVVDEALRKADTQGVQGKEITPFLLSHVANATEGKSLETNMALVQNNAYTAGCIAMELWNLENGDPNDDGGELISDLDELASVIVIGGSVLDRCVTVLDDNINTSDGKIHAGRITDSAGGVGRNIFDALSKLTPLAAMGRQPRFVTVVGGDESAHIVENSLKNTQNAEFIRLDQHRTAQCMVLFDKHGACQFLVGDMSIHGQLTPSVIQERRKSLATALLIVIDANLSLECMEEIFKISHEEKIPVFFEPTDHDCSRRPFLATNWRKAIKYISPNLNELAVIAQHLTETCTQNLKPSNIEEIGKLSKMVAEHVEHVLVTLGAEGLIIAHRHSARHYPALNCSELINVSGAGDCLAAGFITAMLAGKSEEVCVNVGMHSAHCSLRSQSAIPDKFILTEKCWQEPAKFYQL